MQFQRAALVPLLIPYPNGTAHFPPAPLHWDIRYPPRRAARVSGHPISNHDLTRLATCPTIVNVHVISDLLREEWVIASYNPTGVTVEDILTEIHRGLQVPITLQEWEYMSPTERARIESTFYARCDASCNFDRTRYGGVRRFDCLLRTTMFAGLSSPMFRNNRWEVVLTLSRDFSARSRIRGQSEV